MKKPLKGAFKIKLKQTASRKQRWIYPPKLKRNSSGFIHRSFSVGGEYRGRTDDLLHAMQAL